MMKEKDTKMNLKTQQEIEVLADCLLNKTYRLYCKKNILDVVKLQQLIHSDTPPKDTVALMDCTTFVGTFNGMSLASKAILWPLFDYLEARYSALDLKFAANQESSSSTTNGSKADV